MVSNIRLVNEACIKKDDGFVIFGQYKNNKRGLCGVKIKNKNITLPGTLEHFEKEEECGNQDFYVEFMLNTEYYINDIVDIILIKNDKTEIVLKSQILTFPFEEIKNKFPNKNYNVISTIVQNYNNRLDEWIKYHLKLQFDYIVLFDNKTSNSHDNINDITDNYDNVFVIKFPYKSSNDHWKHIQRVSLHIGANGLKPITRYIAIIDADEFVYFPNENYNMNIRNFLEDKNNSIIFGSTIITNKSNQDIFNNNCLQKCIYPCYSLYDKIILFTDSIKENEFIMSPHRHNRHEECIHGGKEIKHYHVWINDRCIYKGDGNNKFEGMKKFLYGN